MFVPMISFFFITVETIKEAPPPFSACWLSVFSVYCCFSPEHKQAEGRCTSTWMTTQEDSCEYIEMMQNNKHRCSQLHCDYI